MILVVGEVLIDVFPRSKRMGGAPYNFACHLKALGEDVRFFSRVGDDDAGRVLLRDLDQRGFDINDLQVDGDAMTGEVFVFVDDSGEPEFSIQSNVAFDRFEVSERLSQAISQGPELLYTGSVIQRTAGVFDVLQRVHEACPKQTLRFFDVNLRSGCWNARDIFSTMEQADVVKLNKHELSVLSRIRKSPDLSSELIERHGLEAVCITRGHEGATLRTSQGETDMPAIAPHEMVDSVGAGDAFAAILAWGTMKGVPPHELLRDASRLAARVCEVEGALPTDPSVYETFRIEWGDKGRQTR